jgi:hypothetical protein
MDRITDETDLTCPDIKSAHTHGTHHAWTASRMDHAVARWVKLGALRAPSLTDDDDVAYVLKASGKMPVVFKRKIQCMSSPQGSLSARTSPHTDKKNEIFLIYKEI